MILEELYCAPPEFDLQKALNLHDVAVGNI